MGGSADDEKVEEDARLYDEIQENKYRLAV